MQAQRLLHRVRVGDDAAREDQRRIAKGELARGIRPLHVDQHIGKQLTDARLGMARRLLILQP